MLLDLSSTLRGRRRAAASALVVAFPAIDEAVGDLRRRLDPTARQGMPAHVTILSPFATPSGREPGAIERLEARLGALPAFTVAFRRIGWFDQRVLYLVPEPAGPFVELTQTAAREFPAFPPYGGRFATVLPHLTIGEDAAPRRLHQAVRAVEALLPLDATAGSVWLMDDDGRAGWRRAHAIELRSS